MRVYTWHAPSVRYSGVQHHIHGLDWYQRPGELLQGLAGDAENKGTVQIPTRRAYTYKIDVQKSYTVLQYITRHIMHTTLSAL